MQHLYISQRITTVYKYYFDLFIHNCVSCCSLAIWNEHQTKIDMVHKILRSTQDKLEEQIKLRKEQVS